MMGSFQITITPVASWSSSVGFAQSTEPLCPWASPIFTPWSWLSSRPLIAPREGKGRQIVSLKVPSAVRYNDRRPIYAAACHCDGRGRLDYLSFADRAEAKDALW